MPGGSLRRLHDGDQRPGAAELLGPGRQAWRSSEPITLEPMKKFPLVRDLVRRSLPAVQRSESDESLGADRRNLRSRPGAGHLPDEAGRALSAVALHQLRMLPGGVPAIHAGESFRRRGRHQPGAALQRSPHRQRPEIGAAGHADGRRRRRRLRQRPATACRSAPRKSRFWKASPRVQRQATVQTDQEIFLTVTIEEIPRSVRGCRSHFCRWDCFLLFIRAKGPFRFGGIAKHSRRGSPHGDRPDGNRPGERRQRPGPLAVDVDVSWPDADFVDAKGLSSFDKIETGRRSLRFHPQTSLTGTQIYPGKPEAVGWVKLTDDVPVHAEIVSDDNTTQP